MGNVLFNGIHIDAQLPVDLKYPVETIAARNAILPEVAYEGMLVYVRDNNRLYILTDTSGLTDGTGWTELGAGTGGGAGLSFQELTVDSDLTRSHLYEIGASSLALTLPANPTVGDTIYFSNSRSFTGTDIVRNGSNIMRLNEDMEIDNPHASFCLIYTDSINGWVIIGGDGGGAFQAGVAGNARAFGTGVNDIAEFARGDTNAQIPEDRIPSSIARDSELPDVSSFITADSTDTLTNKSGSNNQWTNDAGYITASSTDTLTNKSIDAGQLTGTISADRLPDVQYGDVFTYTAADATLANFTAAWIGGVTTGITPVPTTSSVLHSGDIVIIVDTTPDPDSTLTYLYSGADSTFDQFVDPNDFRQISYSGNVLTEAAADARYVRPDSTDTLTNKSIDAGQLTGTIADDRIPSTITRDTEIANFITADSTDTLTNKSGSNNQWTNDAGYITADSTDTLTNKSIDASQLTGTIENARIPAGIARDSEIINVVANPGGTGLATLTTITIGNTDYQIEASGSGGTTLTSLTLTDSEFNVNGETVTFVLSGGPGVQFNLSLDMISPAGWITTGALSSTSGTIPVDGTFDGTITFPTTDMTVNRTARLVATNADDPTNTVNSGLFRQIVGHGEQGDLVAAFELDITGSTVSTSSTIIGGDAPYTLELFDTDPSTGTPTALQTATISNAASRTSPQTHQFTDIDVSAFTPGDYTYYLRVTDSGTGPDMDVLIESESFNVPEPLSGTFNNAGTWYGYLNRNDDAVFQVMTNDNIDSSGGLLFEFTRSSDSSVFSFTSPSGFNNIYSLRTDPVAGTTVLRNGTYELSTWDESTSPRTMVTGPDTITTSISAQTSIDQMVPSFVTTSLDRFRAFIVNTNNDNFINSEGFDYVTSFQDSVPEGSNRSIGSFGGGAGARDILFDIPSTLSGTEITIRCWISDNSDPNAAGAQVIYGPVTQLTIP